jgi:hypothetical protein
VSATGNVLYKDSHHVHLPWYPRDQLPYISSLYIYPQTLIPSQPQITTMLSVTHNHRDPRTRSQSPTPGPTTMLATRWTGHPFHVSLQYIPKPALLTSEDAVIRLTSAAICGSDMHIYHGISGSREPPWTLGHEGVGIVQEVGEAVQLVKPGDRVIVPCILGDGVLEKPHPPTNTYGGGPDYSGNTDGMQGKSVHGSTFMSTAN